MSQDILVDNMIFSPALPEASRPKIAGSNSLQVVSPLTRFTGDLTIDSNVGIGTASAGEKLEVAGNIKIIGDSIINGQALKIMQINRPDWLCINPDEGYPGTALYKPVAINNGGLAVGELSQLAPGQLKVTSSAYLATNNGNVGIGTAQPAMKLDVVGDIRASRYYGINSLTLNDFQTVNPSSNVYLYSPKNDRDSWLFLDSADTGSNWGLYHRQIDSTVKGLPANSLGYIGGGNSDLKAYICLGDGSAFFKGNVGIGTTQPAVKLDVVGDIRASRYYGTNSLTLNDFQTPNPSSNVYLYSPKNDRDSWLFLDSADTGSNWGLYHRQIDSPVKGLPANSFGFIGGGNSDLKAYICLGDGSAYFKSEVKTGSGIIRSGQRPNFYLALQSDRHFVLYDNGAAIWWSNTAISDIRLKKNMVPLTGVLPKLSQLNGIRFNWKDESWGEQSEIGVIAQEVEAIFPELINTDPKTGYKLVQYEKLTPVLLEAIKELKAKNDTLEETVTELKEEVRQVEAKITQ